MLFSDSACNHHAYLLLFNLFQQTNKILRNYMNKQFNEETQEILLRVSDRSLPRFRQGLVELMKESSLTYHYSPTNLGGYYAIDDKGNEMLELLFYRCNNSGTPNTIKKRARDLGLKLTLRKTR